MAPPTAQLCHLTVDIATRSGRNAPVVRVLDSVSLDVGAGCVTALIGESGCGKSMVAAALCGLLPPAAQVTGRILVRGEDLVASGERGWRPLRGHHIDLVPQSAATSFTPVRTIGSQLTEVCERLSADRTPAQLCAAVRLPADVVHRYPHELSGGMAQRAAIAAALAGRPELLIADEPTSALDPANAAVVWQLLAEAASDGAAVLVITHDLPSLLRADVCDDIALMSAGSILRRAATTDMLADPDSYVRRFFAAVTS